MDSNNSMIYPVRVFDSKGKLKREISKKKIINHHWKMFKKEILENRSIAIMPSKNIKLMNVRKHLNLTDPVNHTSNE